MKCPACDAEVAEQAAFCQRCGARLEGVAMSAEGSGDAETGQERFANAVKEQQRRADDPEEELWAGGYSAKAMVGAWLAAGVLTLVVLVVAVMFAQSAAWWGGAMLALLVIWGWPALTLVYRRFDIHYRLTSQRLFHELGILRRRVDRIELIDVDDITYEQGIIDRMMDVGTILVTSSDRTHPRFVMKGIDQVKDVAGMMDAARRKERVRRGLHIASI